MKTIYSVRATFKLHVDPDNLETFPDDVKWLKALEAGTIMPPPENTNIKVTTLAPRIKDVKK